MGKNTLSITICPVLAKWRNSSVVWGAGMFLNVMSLGDISFSLLKFFRTWRGI